MLAIPFCPAAASLSLPSRRLFSPLESQTICSITARNLAVYFLSSQAIAYEYKQTATIPCILHLF
jgi:hypothetical protein